MKQSTLYLIFGYVLIALMFTAMLFNYDGASVVLAGIGLVCFFASSVFACIER